MGHCFSHRTSMGLSFHVEGRLWEIVSGYPDVKDEKLRCH